LIKKTKNKKPTLKNSSKGIPRIIGVSIIDPKDTYQETYNIIFPISIENQHIKVKNEHGSHLDSPVGM
jgi:hypothetical protein